MHPVIEHEHLDADLIRAAWCRATSACPEQWTRSNRARGQCAITSLVVQDVLDGRLLRALVNGESHYWNLLEDGVELDLTLCQFGENPVIEEPVERERTYVMGFPETRQRYAILAQRLEAANIIRALRSTHL